MTRQAAIYPPDRVTLREVGLRDGLQLVKTWPDTDQKRRWLTAEYDAGVRHFEMGSFLPAGRFPQFADLRDVLAHGRSLQGLHGYALALNERGVRDALAAGVPEISLVVSATEAHSQANQRRSRAEALSLVRLAADLAGPDGPLISVGISMAFGCSISGPVPERDVLCLAEAILMAGADTVALADTVGFAGPDAVGRLIAAARLMAGDRPVAVHLHDTRGMAIANAAAALDAGCRILDASLGGLGGCPFAPGATGNVVMEDLVFLAETKGYRTGINLDDLIAVRGILHEAMPEEALHGALARAGPIPNFAGDG